MARYLLRLRKILCLLIDRSSAISSGSSKACFTASATQPAVAPWKFLVEVVANKGTPSNIGTRSQARGSSWGSLLLSAPLFPILTCLAVLWALSSWEGWVFPVSTTSLPLGSFFLFNLAGSSWKGKAGGGVGGLVCATFPNASFPGWDSSNSQRLNLCLHWIPISPINGLNGGSRSKVEVFGDQARLKTSNSSLESGMSTTSSSLVLQDGKKWQLRWLVVVARLPLVCLWVWVQQRVCLLEQGRRVENLGLLC